MNTAEVRVEIISLCMFTDLLRFDTVLLRLLQFKMATVSVHMVPSRPLQFLGHELDRFLENSSMRIS